MSQENEPLEPASEPVSAEKKADDEPAAPAAPEAEKKADDEPDVKLLTKGNPLRAVRGGVTALLGAIFAFLLMAHNGQLRFGVPLGFLFVAVAVFGVMDLLGTFDDPVDRVASTTSLRALAWPILQVVASLLLFGFALMGGQSGVLWQWLWGIFVTASFLGVVASLFDLGVKLGPWAEDELGLVRPLLRRHGFWVIAIGSILYLPTLGSYSLWDPWETHYGEVAREILARDDWISLWWAQDGWFWSKPILNFWIQSLSMATLGTHYQPDQMLIGFHGLPAHPEWVVRAPNFLLTISAMYLLYKGVAKVFGRRAGLMGGIVLATVPDWFFLAHQTMTDMPFVASMTAAMGLLLLGLYTEEERVARVYQVDVGKHHFRLSGWHLVFGVILACAIPQILYLFSRNLELVLHGSGGKGLRVHFDDFKSGSGMGNCGLPGNEACVVTNPASIPHALAPHPEAFGQQMLRLFGGFEPVIQGLFWSVIVGSLLYINWGERRVRRLYYLVAWFFAALATMGKGPAGFLLPMICAFAYVCTKRRFGELLRLELLSGLLIILAVAIPWYLAMYVRHGPPFTDRLIFHDMFNRAFNHVHDTNEGDDTSFRFYAWQLGYAIFPWTGFAPLGLIYWLRRGDSADQGKGDASVFLAMWFIFAFALFSFMGTKFHHYIFPAVPPIAMLIGVVLSDMLGDKYWPSHVPELRFIESAGPPPPDKDLEKRAAHESLMLGAASVAGGFVLALVGRDLIAQPEGAEQPGAIRLLQLFTYNYRRPWPDHLNFTPTLIGFTAAGVLLAFLLGIKKLRPHLVAAFGVFSIVWALWGLDVYMVKTAPHWGQHEVIQAYYTNRAGPEEPIVAYQMNWKGENFYTGNKVPAFVSSGAVFTTWIKQQRDKGVRVIYFVTEHSRVGGLKSEVGGKSFREMTDKVVCNKFILVRAEL
jgi:4-amino-4-deoxy-L-arabinose transferase-like glycosyltransferase